VFSYGHLTRRRGVDPRTLTFAVLDFETTGLDPQRGARVCEVGIVRMRGDGVVLDEYSTLVNPTVPITNDEYHGITDADVRYAPTFEQIAGDVLAYLNGAIVVSHNLEYEEKFLAAELRRVGVRLRKVPGLCTLVNSRIHLDRFGYKLEYLVNLITGEWPSASHSALGDARAAAAMLAKLIAEAPQPLWWSGPMPGPLPALPRSGVITPRAVGLRKGTDGWLATLTARLPAMAHPPASRPEGVREYRALLAHALSDGRIVGEEAHQLATLAARAGLTQTTARQVHEEFLAEARARTEADGVVTSAELRELQRAARELAASHLISDLEEAAAANRARSNGPLKGWRILPVGESPSLSELVDFAVEHGAKVAVNVTKTVRMVVSDGATEDDPRIRKARADGIDVVSPDKARRILEEEIARRRQGGLFADPKGEEIAQRLAAERADPRPTRPEWHEFWRPRELSPAEYQDLFVRRRRDWDEDDDVREITVVVGGSRRQQPQGSGCAAAAMVLGVVLVGLGELIRQVVG
jgi:DNA polymerase-3 subunit epsilon